MTNDARDAKNQLIAKINDHGLDSEKAFFAMVHHEVNHLSGCVLNSELAVFEGGWLVLCVVFDKGNNPEFLFAMSNSEKNICGIALDRDPSCPGWLVELAGQMYLYQQL